MQLNQKNPSNIFEEIGFIIIKPVVHSSMSHADSPIWSNVRSSLLFQNEYMQL